MVRSVFVKAKIRFYTSAQTQLNLPLIRPIRLSFWLIGFHPSTFSEFTFKEPVCDFFNSFFEVDIMINITDQTKDIKKDDSFAFGPFSNPIGEGIVIERYIK